MEPSTTSYVFEDPKPLWCSRFRTTKRDAERDARWMRNHGGKRVTITGRRGLWRVRAKMPVGEFARFCAIEAARENKEQSNA